MKFFFTICAAVVFWILLIGGILYIPYIKIFKHDNRVLHVFTWTEMIDPIIIAQFEQETGISVVVTYYENNEELRAKLVYSGSMQGGYDIVVPTDYMAQQLIQDNLVKKIDRTKLDFWDRLDSRMCGLYFDPTNSYSIPFYWDIYGLGIDRRAFNPPAQDISWDLVFNAQKTPGAIGMLNDPREAILLGYFYYYSNLPQTIFAAQLEPVQKLLQEQKKWVGIYTDVRADYLLTTHACPLAVTQGSFMYRAQGQHGYLTFDIPREGGFAIVDTLLIPASSTKDSLVYQFINFLYRPEIIEHHYKTYGLFPCVKNFNFPLDISQLMPLKFLSAHIDPQVVHALWIELKAW